MEQLPPSDEVLELDQRQNDALTVTLWWVRGTLDTFVTVEDGKGDNFTVDVPDAAQANHYFHHAMAYHPTAGHMPRPDVYGMPG